MSSILLIVLDANTRAEIHRLASTDSTMAVSDAVGTLAAARDALVNGRWDAIGELLDGASAVKTTAAKLPYLAA